MPSLAIPTAVVATVPSAAIAQTGQSADNLAAEAGAPASAGMAAGGGAFAALLGRQMASPTAPAEGAAAALIAAADQSEAAPTNPAVDLSVLLQGLLLPISTRPEGAQAGNLNSASTDAQATRSVQVSPGTTVPTEVSIRSTADPAAESSTSGDAWPGFAQLIADDARQAAADAAIAGKPAGSATRELPLQFAQPELQPAASMVSHALPAPVRIERESLIVPTPVTSPTWHEDLGNKVSMLIGKEATSADLVLTPPHLGRVEVQLSMSGDQTSATFVAATPAAREALEQALPKLREFLADAGINLTQATVGGDTQAGQGNADGNRGNRPGQGGHSGAVTEITAQPASMRRIDGLVDTFA